jgi:hypothetical protein
MSEAMATPAPQPKRVPCSVRLHPQLISRAKRLARDCAGKPLYLTLSVLVEQGLEKECTRIERLLDIENEDQPEPSKSRHQGTDRIRRINNESRTIGRL